MEPVQFQNPVSEELGLPSWQQISKDVQALVMTTLEQEFYYRWVRNRLAEVLDVIKSFMARKPAHGPEFTRPYKVNRLAFSFPHVHCNLGQ